MRTTHPLSDIMEVGLALWKCPLFKTLSRQERERKSRHHFGHILFPVLFLLFSCYLFSAIIIIPYLIST